MTTVEHTNLLSVEALKRIIEKSLRKQIKSYVEDIADKACADLRKQIMAEVDTIAISVMQSYEVYASGSTLTIKVDKSDLIDAG